VPRHHRPEGMPGGAGSAGRALAPRRFPPVTVPSTRLPPSLSPFEILDPTGSGALAVRCKSALLSHRRGHPARDDRPVVHTSGYLASCGISLPAAVVRKAHGGCLSAELQRPTYTTELPAAPHGAVLSVRSPIGVPGRGLLCGQHIDGRGGYARRGGRRSGWSVRCVKA